MVVVDNEARSQVAMKFKCRRVKKNAPGSEQQRADEGGDEVDG